MRDRGFRRPAVRRWLPVAAFVVAFAAALTWWTDGFDTGSSSLRPLAGASGSSGGATGPSTTALTASPGSSASVPATGGTLTAFPGLPGFPDLNGPGATAFGHAGPHTVVLTVRSSGPIGAIGYVVRHNGSGEKIYGAPTPWQRTFTVDRQYTVAVLAVQVAPDQQWASCEIAVDGQTVSKYTAEGPYEVVACVA